MSTRVNKPSRLTDSKILTGLLNNSSNLLEVLNGHQLLFACATKGEKRYEMNRYPKYNRIRPMAM
jgi:hypothetical protein